MEQAARAARHQGEDTLRRLTAAALLAFGCASPGMPPGGPPDVAAPQILAITPDSGTVGIKPKEVLFRFDEVVSERPPSATSLADLFLISPRDGAPDVSWHRDAISVRPPHGWRSNTPYTVIMLRGLADLRGNVRNTGAMTFFSTGRALARTRIAGRAFDWVSGNPATGALVESFVPPDSAHPYVALVDSSGAFSLEHLPPGRYLVRVYLDRNRNLAIDPSEPWDSVTIDVTDSVRTELAIFTHDTVPPRLRTVSAIESLTLRLTFDKPLDPAQTLTAANFAVLGPDSMPLPLASGSAAPRDTAPRRVTSDTAAGRPAARALPARGDTAAAPRPVMSRPIPVAEAIIRLGHPLAPRTAYRVRALGIRGLLGRAGDSERGYTPPVPPPPAAPGKPALTPPVSPPPARQ